METLRAKMIDLIQRNRISATEVADALGKRGVLDDIDILIPGQFKAGEVQYVYGHSESNWSIHEQIQNIKENTILYVDTFNCNNKAAFGDLVSKYLILYKKVQAIVVNGLMRDNHTIYKEKYPIWCKGVTPLGCFNKNIPETPEMKEEIKKNQEKFKDGILVCDDTGCTLIESGQITEDFYKKLEFIEIQEDIWFYCIDTLKWTTYETVCLKKYKETPDLLPKHLADKLTDTDLEKQ